MQVASHPWWPTGWTLPEAIRRRLGTSPGRQRAMAAEGHLLLILHAPPEPDQTQRAARLFWRLPDGQWKSSDLGTGTAALAEHLQQYRKRVERHEEHEDSARVARDYFGLLRDVVPLHRTVRNLHSALQQARELVPDDRDLIAFRDEANDLERALELLHSDLQNGLSFTVAFQAEQQAAQGHAMAVSAHRLNLLAALFFPIGALAAVFGMNLSHGLDRFDSPALFWTVLAAGLVTGIVLALGIASRPARAPLAPRSAATTHSRNPAGGGGSARAADVAKRSSGLADRRNPPRRP